MQVLLEKRKKKKIAKYCLRLESAPLKHTTIHQATIVNFTGGVN